VRLGFCGVGRWASKLAEQFRACGAEVAVYDRKTIQYEESRVIGAGGVQVGTARHLNVIDDPPGLGTYKPWRDQLEDPRIDAIVAAADPETTTAVALACAAAGKPCMATKPLMVTEMPALTAPLYVDLWRLWGDRWKRAKDAIKAYGITNIDFTGLGPFRSFPGMFDYGPHAVAFLLDLDARPHLCPEARYSGDLAGGDRLTAHFLVNGHVVTLRVGSGWPSPVRQISTRNQRVLWDEPPTLDKSGEIRAMCQSFLNDIHESNVSTYTLDLSIRGMRLLQEARAKAGAK
jgi:hypothetical protein